MTRHSFQNKMEQGLLRNSDVYSKVPVFSHSYGHQSLRKNIGECFLFLALLSTTINKRWPSMLGPVSRLLTVVLGYAYPSYATYKALNTKGNSQEREWCIYWMVLGFFLVFEWPADLVLSWLPLYYELKLALLVAMWHPRVQGAAYIYERVIKPILGAHEARIDNTVEDTKLRVVDGVLRGYSQARGYAAAHSSSLLRRMSSFANSNAQVESSGSQDAHHMGHHKK